GEIVCSRCNDKKVIDKLGHIDENSDGYCDRCNELFDSNAYNSYLFKNIRLSIRKPSTTIIPYGHTLRLYAEVSKPLPKGYSLKWTMTGDGVTIIPSNDNSYCDVRATGKGNATVSVQIVDDAGNTPKFVNQSNVYRSQDVSTASSFFRMIAYFFKTLFRINTIIDK
ncbi:MAG: hypothetical protein IKH65_04375, partial [Clostridia bacterium]|nr:hypothetical protein [Clostridia bacterium]